jgi:sodium-dependent dicarboxylate transporter 2/3/5
MIALVQTYDLPHKGVLLPAAVSLSLACILVDSSPTNLIPYSTGYFSITDMAKAGIAMTVVTSAIIACTFFLIGSLAGIY